MMRCRQVWRRLWRKSGCARPIAGLSFPARTRHTRAMSKRPLWLAAAPVIFLLLWSAGFAIAKLGLNHAEPLTILALRYVCVLVLLIPLALILRPPMPKTLRAWIDIAVVGFLIQVVYFGLCYVAFKSGISAGGVAIIVCLQPILVALAAPYLVGETVSRLGWIGLVLGLGGAGLVIVSRSGVGAENPWGVGCAALALLGITAGTLWEKRFGVAHHPITANLVQYAVGAAFTLPAAWATEGMVVRWDGTFIAVMAYLVVGNSLLAISLLLAMIRAGEVSRVSALFYLVPALAALFAWPVLGETMTPMAWVGMALAGGGVALVSRKSA
jgi:drug/metabolite transporter (DMT)-like permease